MDVFGIEKKNDHTFRHIQQNSKDNFMAAEAQGIWNSFPLKESMACPWQHYVASLWLPQILLLNSPFRQYVPFQTQG